MQVSDFRSDTVTRPSPAMRAAMLAAEVGDDVLDGDPTVRALERAAAERLGKERALFVPSGTMANQIAIGTWLAPGDELICERSSHVVCWESGAVAALHGVQSLTLHAPNGQLDPAEVRAACRIDSVHCPRTRLLSLEQTFMGSGEAAGGMVLPLERMRALAETAREMRLRVHVDGARLFHAEVAAGVPAAEFASCADSVSICLSKGLGAPVGSLIVGDTEFIERAFVLRKRLGGWMRQAGILAAAGLHALEHNVERLALDHALAQEVAALLGAVDGLDCDPRSVETNIVMARVTRPGHDAASVIAALGERGVRCLDMNPEAVRFVTHMDVGAADLERLERALAGLF